MQRCMYLKDEIQIIINKNKTGKTENGKHCHKQMTNIFKWILLLLVLFIDRMDFELSFNFAANIAKHIIGNTTKILVGTDLIVNRK